MCMENQMMNELARQKSRNFLVEADEQRRAGVQESTKRPMALLAAVAQIFGLGK